MNRILILFLLTVIMSGCVNQTTSIWFENDALSYGPPTDANYTQGLQVAVQNNENYQPCDEGIRPGLQGGDADPCITHTFGKKFINKINFARFQGVDQEIDYPIRLEYVFGQQFYTPNDLRPSTVQENDRPYAGWLFGGIRIHNLRVIPDSELESAPEKRQKWLNDRRRTVTFQAGVVGPWSQASAIQKWWHEDVCDCTYPNGWDLQVKNELGLLYSVSQDDRISYYEFNEDFSVDILTKIDATIGNVITHLEGGGTIRLGYNLPRSFSSGTISGHLYRLGTSASSGIRESDREFHAFAFVGGLGRLVGRDIFLDGNTFRSSPHEVDKELFFTEGQIGATIGYGGFGLTVLYAHRSKQFETQAQDHRFGSYLLTFNRPF